MRPENNPNIYMNAEEQPSQSNKFPVGPYENFQLLRHKIAQRAAHAPVVVQFHDGLEWTVPKGASADKIQQQYDALIRED